VPAAKFGISDKMEIPKMKTVNETIEAILDMWVCCYLVVEEREEYKIIGCC